MYFSVDRFEGEMAVLIDEQAKPLEVPKTLLPDDVKEGDMVLYENSVFIKSPEKTEERRSQMAEMLADLLRENDD